MDKKKICLIILIIFLSQTIQLISWINKDSSNPAWDQSWHAMISTNKYMQLFGKTNLTTEQIEEIYPIFRFANNYYPPFYHISTVPFYIVFGNNYDSALLTNLFFLFILIVSSFFIGKKLYNAEAGLVISFIISTIPIHSLLMRDYLIDFSLSAMVALGFVLLLYTDHFENIKYSLLFGLAFGLGILTKWSYPIYLIIPLCYSLYTFFRKNFYEKKNYNKIKNIVFPLILTIVTASIWYIFSKIKILIPTILMYSKKGFVEGDPSFSSTSGLTHYFNIIINDYSFFYFIIFVISMIFLIKNFKESKTKTMLLLQIVFIYIFFTILSNKDARYILPVYIFLALFAGEFITNLDKKKIKYLFIFIIVIFGFLQNFSYNSKNIDFDYQIGRIKLIDLKGKYPSTGEFNIKEMLDNINNSNNKNSFSLCIASESSQLNDVNIPYNAMIENYPVSKMIGNGCNPLEFDYTLVGPIKETWRSNTFKSSKSMLEQNKKNFKEIYSLGEVTIYEKK